MVIIRLAKIIRPDILQPKQNIAKKNPPKNKCWYIPLSVMDPTFADMLAMIPQWADPESEGVAPNCPCPFSSSGLSIFAISSGPTAFVCMVDSRP